MLTGKDIILYRANLLGNTDFVLSMRDGFQNYYVSMGSGLIKNSICGGAVLVMFMSVNGVANAALYTVSGSIVYEYPRYISVIDEYDITTPISVGREVHHELLGVKDYHASAHSLADSSGVHAYAANEIIHQVSGESGTIGYKSNAFAKASYGDFFIRAPVGVTTVQTAINFHMSGQQGLGWYVPTLGSGSGVLSSVDFSMQINGTGYDGGTRNLLYNNGIPSAPSDTGMLVGFNGDMNLKTKVFTLPVNTLIPMALYLTAASSVWVDFADSFRTSSYSDFGGTLTFATDRPVFDLPLGYSVDSAEAGVVDNMFAAPVPLPSAVWLFGSGLLGLFGMKKRGSVA